MSVYQSQPSYINKRLVDVPAEAKRHERLRIDLTDLLIGPTCGGEAERLVELMLDASLDKEIVSHLEATVARWRTP